MLATVAPLVLTLVTFSDKWSVRGIQPEAPHIETSQFPVQWSPRNSNNGRNTQFELHASDAVTEGDRVGPGHFEPLRMSLLAPKAMVKISRHIKEST